MIPVEKISKMVSILPLHVRGQFDFDWKPSNRLRLSAALLEEAAECGDIRITRIAIQIAVDALEHSNAALKLFSKEES